MFCPRKISNVNKWHHPHNDCWTISGCNIRKLQWSKTCRCLYCQVVYLLNSVVLPPIVGAKLFSEGLLSSCLLIELDLWLISRHHGADPLCFCFRCYHPVASPPLISPFPCVCFWAVSSLAVVLEITTRRKLKYVERTFTEIARQCYWEYISHRRKWSKDLKDSTP